RIAAAQRGLSRGVGDGGAGGQVLARRQTVAARDRRRRRREHRRPRPAQNREASATQTGEAALSRILVTGATGFLGKHLLRRLDPARVRVLGRVPTKGLRKLEVEVVKGDLLDEAVLAQAVRGVSQIYHLAGLVSRNPDDAHDMYRVHVVGTRMVWEAALRERVERVVVASSSGTVAVGEDPDRVFTEADGYATETVTRWPYYLSKIYQEQTALRFASEQGLDVVVLCPSLLLGPGDARQSSTGDVLKFLTGSIPVVPSGGLNFV